MADRHRAAAVNLQRRVAPLQDVDVRVAVGQVCVLLGCEICMSDALSGARGARAASQAPSTARAGRQASAVLELNGDADLLNPLTLSLTSAVTTV